MIIKNTTIAILMTTYNGEKFLEAQLESIISQTYKNFKIYISDDKSSDSTIDILFNYQQKYPTKIFYSVNQHNLGFVKNFEKLLKSCKEPYIALSDQDDIWFKNKLEIQLEKIKLIEKDNPAMVHSDLIMINNNGGILQESFLTFRKIKLQNIKSINKIISHNGVIGCSTMFNQKLRQNLLPFPDNLDVHDYWIAIVNEVLGIRYTMENPLIYYRIHENNTSNNIEKIKEEKNIFTKFFNKDSLPFIGLGRDTVLKELLNRFSSNLSVQEVKIINAFLIYLDMSTNPIKTFFTLIQYNLIREDISYRIKIFIKLIQKR